jgi:hypothetical protein
LFPFVLRKVSDVGVVSHWSVAGTSNVKFFLSKDGVYMMAVDDHPTKISDDIEPDLLATEQDDWQYASALFHPEHREYWLYLRTEGEAYFFDLQAQAWGKWSGWGFNLIGQIENQDGSWQGYGGDDYGHAYKLDDGTSDNGVAIDMQIDTKAYDFGLTSAEKQVRQVMLYTDKDSAWTITASHRTDFNAWVADETLLSTGDQSQGTGMYKIRYFPLSDNVGRYFELRFRNNQADKALTVYGWSLLPHPLGRR